MGILMVGLLIWSIIGFFYFLCTNGVKVIRVRLNEMKWIKLGVYMFLSGPLVILSTIGAYSILRILAFFTWLART